MTEEWDFSVRQEDLITYGPVNIMNFMFTTDLLVLSLKATPWPFHLLFPSLPNGKSCGLTWCSLVVSTRTADLYHSWRKLSLGNHQCYKGAANKPSQYLPQKGEIIFILPDNKQNFPLLPLPWRQTWSLSSKFDIQTPLNRYSRTKAVNTSAP